MILSSCSLGFGAAADRAAEAGHKVAIDTELERLAPRWIARECPRETLAQQF